MKLTLKDIKGQSLGDVDLAFPLIENGRGSQAVHDTVVAYQANQRMGTACTKTMGAVAGTGKKPWRQKGTGRARAGSFQSPLWRGGGVVFGPKPRDFGKKVNKTTRRLALQKALSERLKAGDVVVVDDLKLTSPRTKDFVTVLQALQGVDEALTVLRFTPKKGARFINKTLQSALASAENTKKMDIDRLIVKTIYVDKGPVLKRFQPRAMGRATPILKRTSHITVVLSD